MARRGRPSKLTPETERQIVKGITLGAFPYVAAVAAGIDKATFYRWLAAAEEPDAPKKFRDFRDKVERAEARVRMRVEAEVRKINPLAWLRYGPGRDRPGAPGWTEPKAGTEVNVFGGIELDARKVLIPIHAEFRDYLDRFDPDRLNSGDGILPEDSA